VNDIAGGEEQDGPANNYGDFLYIYLTRDSYEMNFSFLKIKSVLFHERGSIRLPFCGEH
jgi:hypothetical protein